MIQQLENSCQSHEIVKDNVVLGTVGDLKKEHDWLLARVHKLRELLQLQPLVTDHQRKYVDRLNRK